MTSIKKSFLWSALEQIGPKVLQFSVAIVLARVLEPEDFGLVGMLVLFTSLAQIFADSGLSASLIQKENITEDDETSVFYINIGMGVGVALLLCVISPLVAAFYDQPQLIALLCLHSLSVVITSFTIVHNALIIRAMEFHKTAWIGVASTLGSGIVGLGMAFTGFGVWSLIGLVLAQNVTQAVLLWSVNDWRPKGQLKRENLRSIWSFSSYLLFCQLIGVANKNIHSVIIGKFYSLENLGFYNRANNLRMLPANTMAGMINKVAFPVFSRCQGDKGLLLRRIRKLVRTSLVFSAAGMALLAVLADQLVPFLMTDKWLPAVPLLRILCYAAALVPVSALYLMALQAQGYSKLNFRLESIKMVVSVCVVSTFCWFGVTAIAWGVVLMTVIAYFMNAFYQVKLLGYSWKLQMFDIMPTLILCAIAAVLTLPLVNLEMENAVMIMSARCVVFICTLGIGTFMLRNVFFGDIWLLIESMLRKSKPTSKGI